MRSHRSVARARVSALVCGLALLTTGCGPNERADLGMRTVDQQIVFGSQGRPTTPPPPVTVPPPVFVNPGPTFPTIVQPPPPVQIPTRLPQPAPACPTANPLSVPELPVTSRVETLPAPGSYAFRNELAQTVAGSVVRSNFVSHRTVGSVHRVTQADGSTVGLFDVTDSSSGDPVTTSYKVVHDTSPLEQQAGVLVTRVTRTHKDGSTDVFSPVPALVFAPFPLQPQTTWDSLGSDPLSQSSIELQGTVDKTVTVDACGALLQAWRLTMTGRIATPDAASDFTATVDLVSQYGGLSAADTFVRTVVGASSPTESNRATISEVPRRAQG